MVKIENIAREHTDNIKELREKIELIFNLIKSGGISGEEVKYREIINKIFIIDIYSNWEQFFKKSISYIYEEYRKVLFTKSTINYLFNEMLKRARKIDINNDGYLVLSKIIISTNNLNFSSAETLLANVGFNIDLFSTLLLNNNKIHYCIEKIRNSGIAFTVDDICIHKKNKPHDIINAIYTIVDSRNEYAHTGKSSIFLNKEQMLKYCSFFVRLIKEIKLYFINQIYIKKGDFYSNTENKETSLLKVIQVIYENTPNQGKMSCSLQIKSRKKIELLDQYTLFLKDGKNYFSVNEIILEDMNQQNISYILRGEQYIKFNTECRIKKGKKLELYIYRHKPSHAIIKLN